MEQLTELQQKDALFGIPTPAFFVPRPDHRYRIEKYGVELGTPSGVAAGPATQMAQNIIMSWLVGARFLELKTIRTLDELDVSKPCIEIEDEGYYVEWSQELKVYQSLDEYLRAWVLIHALHHKFGWHGDRPGMIFNMSVGYNLEGMLKPNVQWFFDTMADASQYLPAYIGIVARRRRPRWFVVDTGGGDVHDHEGSSWFDAPPSDDVCGWRGGDSGRAPGLRGVSAQAQSLSHRLRSAIFPLSARSCVGLLRPR